MKELTFEERLAMMVDVQWLARLKRLFHAANLRGPSAPLSDLSYRSQTIKSSKVCRRTASRAIPCRTNTTAGRQIRL